MSLQSERIQLLMQRLSLTEMVHGYEALAEQAAQLKSDLAAEVARTKKLAKSLDEVKKVLQEQQRKRMENQSPER